MITRTEVSRTGFQTFRCNLSLGDRNLGLCLDSQGSRDVRLSGEILRADAGSPCRGQADAYVVHGGRVLARSQANLKGRFSLRFDPCDEARLVVRLPDRSAIRVQLDPLLEARPVGRERGAA